jgi:hypothetical protein
MSNLCALDCVSQCFDVQIDTLGLVQNSQRYLKIYAPVPIISRWKTLLEILGQLARSA